MTTFELVLIALLAVASLFPFWALYCNEKTYRQRQKLLPSAGDTDFWEKMRQFQKVSYNRHNWYLLTFRNPDELYR
jgi:hypothetical protein